MATHVGDVIDALVDIAGSAITVEDVQVKDGPQPNFDPPPKRFVGIGWDSDEPDGSGESARVDQRWAASGNRGRDEHGEVNGVVAVWTGDTNAKGRRDVALDILSQLETGIRANPTFGVSYLRNGQLATGNLSQTQEANGVRVWIAFTVSYDVRI